MKCWSREAEPISCPADVRMAGNDVERTVEDASVVGIAGRCSSRAVHPTPPSRGARTVAAVDVRPVQGSAAPNLPDVASRLRDLVAGMGLRRCAGRRAPPGAAGSDSHGAPADVPKPCQIRRTTAGSRGHSRRHGVCPGRAIACSTAVPRPALAVWESLTPYVSTGRPSAALDSTIEIRPVGRLTAWDGPRPGRSARPGSCSWSWSVGVRLVGVYGPERVARWAASRLP
jgi:hypothetical protein